MDDIPFPRFVQRLLKLRSQGHSLRFLAFFEQILKLVDERFDMNLHPSIGDGSLFAFAQVLNGCMLVRHRSAQIIKKFADAVNR